MQLDSDIVVAGQIYRKGTEVPWYWIYPPFAVHMLLFGSVGFAIAYGKSDPPEVFLYLHGGLAIFVYTMMYRAMFGRDQVVWMFLNAAFGIAGIFTQIGWLLSKLGKRIDDYPYHLHVIPFLYFILYTFLIRHAFLDLFNARTDPKKRKIVEATYVMVSIAINFFFWQRRR